MPRQSTLNPDFRRAVLATPPEFDGQRERMPVTRTTAVIGGGLAGVAAATVLAERGMGVTLLEAKPYLGGRAGAWVETMKDGTSFAMERGFHAFFRQYYNLRRLLRRVDPTLSCLMPVPDYPILTPDGHMESFANLPLTPPLNVARLTLRTRSLSLGDLLRVDKGAALEMLRYERGRTYERFDHVNAKTYLDSLGFPELARQRLLHVFAHSCFNPQEDMSAAALLEMFHFYFTGNHEGLIFDVASRPFSTAIFEPLRERLEERGVGVLTGTAVQAVRRKDGGWLVEHERGAIEADDLVLALDVPAMSTLLAASPDLDDSHLTEPGAEPTWRQRMMSLRATNPFAVWRLWLDQPVTEGRVPFAGTAGVGRLDNISLYHLFEDESRRWAERTGGSVVELHAYALPHDTEEAALKVELLAGLNRLYPETAGAGIIEDRFLWAADCPSFAPGSAPLRPGVATPFKGVAVAGDFARLPFPSCLMERAVSAGMLAANVVLDRYDVRPEPLWSVPVRGLLAPRNVRSTEREDSLP